MAGTFFNNSLLLLLMGRKKNFRFCLHNRKVIKLPTGLFFLKSEDLIQFTFLHHLHVKPAKTSHPIFCLNLPAESKAGQKMPKN